MRVGVWCHVRGACEASSLSDVSSWIPGRSAGYHTIVVGTQVRAAWLDGVAGRRGQSLLHVMTQPCELTDCVFQECLFLRELRRAIWRHLGGPESYAMYAEEIGSAQLNGHIGLTVWVRCVPLAHSRVSRRHRRRR